MNAPFLSFAWLLSGLVLIGWVAAGYAILRGALAIDPPRLWSSRLLWLPLWLLCGVGGFWGAPVHEATDSSFAEANTIPPASETTISELRTPFVVREATRTRGPDGALIESEERAVIQLPLALIVFLGGFGILKHRLHCRTTQARGESAGRRGAVAFLLLPLLLPLGCAPAADAEVRPDRMVQELAWDTIFLIESEPDDSLLFRIDRLAADGGGFSVLDGVGSRIARFDWAGGLQWYAGRKGGGPGELEQPRDLRTDESGATWVLDVVSRRITGYDASGSMFQEVPLHELPPFLDEFALSPGAQTFLSVIPENGALQVVEFDRLGNVTSSSRVVLSRKGQPPSMALQGKIGSTAGEKQWSYAFSSGDGLFRFSGTTELGARVLYPDAIPFPEIAEEITQTGATTSRSTRVVSRTYGAVATTIWENRAFVLLMDEDRSYRMLDIYELSTGTYLESLRLPHGASAVAIRGTRLLLGYNAPHPTVLGLTLDLRGRESS